ncbi:MAG: DUF1653 domain-containing protein [Pseudomonadales bacterium]|nr:DUF1653 domain-containing protein [Pseudomonadales bacterium]
MSIDDIKQGTYRHFKGGFYEVLGTVRHSETEEWMVLYRPVSGDSGLWVRPVSMFIEEVSSGVPRFAKCSETQLKS